MADGKYYKKKGVVEQVVDRYVGVISMLDADVKGHKLKLDQSQLETVIPAIGGKVCCACHLLRCAKRCNRCVS